MNSRRNIQGKKQDNDKGFTLVEMIVAVGLFAIVMVVASGAIFSIVNANRKAQALDAAITNFSFALESMVRDIKTGSNYRCGSFLTSAGDCPTGTQTISLINSSGVGVEYDLDTSKHQITKILNLSNSSAEPITAPAPEVTIQSMEFYITGTTGNSQQPEVLLSITGYTGKGQSLSPFDVQTLISQRLLNAPSAPSTP